MRPAIRCNTYNPYPYLLCLCPAIFLALEIALHVVYLILLDLAGELCGVVEVVELGSVIGPEEPAFESLKIQARDFRYSIRYSNRCYD